MIYLPRTSLSIILYVQKCSDSHCNPFYFGAVDDEKRLNAIYIISVARKLGCSVFLLPEDIMEVFFEKSVIFFSTYYTQ